MAEGMSAISEEPRSMRCPSYYRERFLDRCFPNIKLDADDFGGGTVVADA